MKHALPGPQPQEDVLHLAPNIQAVPPAGIVQEIQANTQSLPKVTLLSWGNKKSSIILGGGIGIIRH